MIYLGIKDMNNPPFSSSSSSPMFFMFLIFFVIAPTLSLSNKPEASIKYLKNYNQLQLPKVVGPESIAFDCKGEGPYVGVSDGRILKWQGPHLGWTEFAITSPNRQRNLCDGSTNPDIEPKCGRPLGLKFNPTSCNLYIADAYFGLLMVGPTGGAAEQLATSAQGIPFRLTNALDIDPQTGVVYFTDASFRFQRRVWLLSILTGDKTGRLMQYDPNTKKVNVLLKGLAFANGVALSKDNSFLLLAESTTSKIIRFWLRGPKAQTSEVFAQLSRSPDNIKRNKKGEFWIGLNSGRGIFKSKQLLHFEDEIPWWRNDPVATKFDEEGKVLEVLDGNGGTKFDSISEVEEHKGNLWIGSAVKPYVGYIMV